MDLELDNLLQRLQELEEEFERKAAEHRAALEYRVENGRVVFTRAILDEHRQIRQSVIQFLRQSTVGGILIAPLVYVLILPFVLLDLGVWVYQSVCFAVWGIAPVRRGNYIVLDRHHLAYLNGIEKLNCLYCGYANGLIAYVREVAARTEQYWCPIKHAVRTRGTHARHRQFVDYGDGAAFRARLENLRADVRHARREGL